MKKISKAQVKTLRALASKAFPNDALYHEWLYAQFGKESTLDLSTAMGHRAIQMLLPDWEKVETHGSASVRKGYYPDGSGWANHLSDKQAKNIGGLAADLGWSMEGLLKFIKRQTGQDKTVEMLSGKEATKVIIGLKRVLQYKQDYRMEANNE